MDYDRRDWQIGVTSWFHVQMNLLRTIMKTHWGLIQGDCTIWGRTQHSLDGSKYHLMAPLVVQGFTSRVVAVFYQALQRRGFQIGAMERISDLDNSISRLTPAGALDVIKEVRELVFEPAAWGGQLPDGHDHGDPEFTSLCRYLQSVRTFLIIGHAVKHGDIGLLRRTVPLLAVMFFGAGQHNYGHEMLHYHWLLSDASSLELQHAVLASGLVNWTGKAGSFKPIDLSLEHLNAGCKLDMSQHKNSTHDVTP